MPLLLPRPQATAPKTSSSCAPRSSPARAASRAAWTPGTASRASTPRRQALFSAPCCWLPGWLLHACTRTMQKWHALPRILPAPAVRQPCISARLPACARAAAGRPPEPRVPGRGGCLQTGRIHQHQQEHRRRWVVLFFRSKLQSAPLLLLLAAACPTPARPVRRRLPRPRRAGLVSDGLRALRPLPHTSLPFSLQPSCARATSTPIALRFPPRRRAACSSACARTSSCCAPFAGCALFFFHGACGACWTSCLRGWLLLSHLSPAAACSRRRATRVLRPTPPAPLLVRHLLACPLANLPAVVPAPLPWPCRRR